MLGNGLGRSVEQQLVPIALMLFTGQRDGATGRMGKEIAVDVKRQARCLLSRKIGVKQAVALARLEGDGDGNLRCPVGINEGGTVLIYVSLGGQIDRQT